MSCLPIQWRRRLILSAAVAFAACSSSSTTNDAQIAGGSGGTTSAGSGGASTHLDAAVASTGGSIDSGAGGSTTSGGGSTGTSNTGVDAAQADRPATDGTGGTGSTVDGAADWSGVDAPATDGTQADAPIRDSQGDSQSDVSYLGDRGVGSDASGGGDGGTVGLDAAPLPTPDFVWYVLDETQGAVAHDSSSHHYDITNLTGVTWDHGASFDGKNGGGSVAVDSSYRSAPITIGAWLTPTARADETSTSYSLTPYPTNAIGDDIQAQWGFGIGLNVWTDGVAGSALAVEDVGTCQGTPTAAPHDCTVSPSIGASPVTFVPGQEYFVVAAIGTPGADGGTSSSAHVYVNGSLFSESTADAISGGATTLWLGVHNNDTAYGTRRFFAGRIRDVRIYKRELAASEITQLYAVGPTLKAP